MRDITHRRSLELEREAALVKYRTLFDTLPVGVTVSDDKGWVVEANRIAIQILGLSSADHLRRHIEDPGRPIVRPDGSRMPPDEFPGVRAFREGRPVRDVELGVLKDNSETTWISVTATPLSLSGFGVVITCTDIGTRRRSETALRESEHLLRQMGRVAKVGGWELEVDSGRGRWTEEVARIHGLDPETATDRGLGLSFYHGESRTRIVAAMERAIRDREPYDLELELITRSGDRRWVRTIGEPVVEGDRVVRLRGAFQDLTELKSAERELYRIHQHRERALRFSEALLAAIPTPVFYKDREGRYLGCNARFSELMGVTSDQIRGRTAHDLWPSAPAEVYASMDLDLIAHPGEQTREFTVRDKNGRDRDVILVKNVFLDEAGQVAGVIGAFLDISERKRMEARLRESLLFRREAEKIARIGAWKVSPATDYLYWTEGIHEIVEAPPGYGPGLEEGLQLYDAGAIPSLRTAIETALRDGTPFTLEIGLTTFGGRHLWTEVRGFGRIEEGGQAFVMGTLQDITGMREAREALAAREQIFSSIVEQATDAIAVVDGATARFVEFNTTAHEGLGYSREEFRGMSVLDVQAEQTGEEIAATISLARRDGVAIFETTHRHRDGGIRDVRVSVRPLDLHGRDYVASVWTDITDRKRAESRAAHDRIRIEFLLHLHRVAPQMADGELHEHVMGMAVRLTESTVGFVHTLGPGSESALLTSWADSTCARFLADPGPMFAVQGDGPWQNCIRRQTPVLCNDGSHSPPSGALPQGQPPLRRFMSIPVIQDARVVMVVSVGNKAGPYTEDDLAQLQVVSNEFHKILSQRAVQNQLRQLSRAVEQSPASVVITDLSGTIEYANPSFTRISGYSLEEVLGRNPRVLNSGGLPREHYRQLWETILSGRVWQGEFQNRKKNGELHWESASVSPITDPTGRITHFVAVKEDITERKRLESQLLQAQKLEGVGQLAGGVAHDFNNIIAAIMMHLGLLQMHPHLDHETVEALKELEGEARRAASLTRQLLMFSRRSVLAVQPQNLNDLVANLLKMLGRLIGENIKLCFESANPLPPVEADAGMLEQVLMNLVVNARDAMPRGGVITIATSCLELDPETAAHAPDRRPGRFVRLTVADNGTGMDDATLKRIFEPFFTTKEAGKGTGLGLATVHGIVAQHRGWVEVDSAVGRGTTFQIFLPAMITAPSSAPDEDAPSAEPLKRGRETILVAEDEPTMRRVLCRMLRSLGYRVHEAENGQEAMRIWQRTHAEIDLLLTDMVMPEGLTGLELAERLQASRPGLKVIISSGYSAEIVHSGVPTRSGITYLPKPYDERTLADTVRSCLDPAS